MGVVDAETAVDRDGSKSTVVWGELDTKNALVRKGRKESGTGSEAEHPNGVATHGDYFGTVIRDIDRAYFTVVLRELEHFFMSGRIPDNSLSSFVSGHDPPAVLGNDDGIDPDIRLHGWTLLLRLAKHHSEVQC